MEELLSGAPWQWAVIWLISLVSIALVLVRPKGLLEALWATLGASLQGPCAETDGLSLQ